MTIHFQFVHGKNHEWMEQFIQERLDKLEKKYPWIIQAKVILKTDKGAAPDGHICEIELSVPGPQLFAKAQAASFEAAVAETIERLERLLEKKKAKMYHQ